MRSRQDRRRHIANLKFVHLFTPGAKVRGKFSEDGVWYDAVVQGPGEYDKVVVVYEGYGNIEEVTLGKVELVDPPPPPGCPGHKDNPKDPEDELWCVAGEGFSVGRCVRLVLNPRLIPVVRGSVSWTTSSWEKSCRSKTAAKPSPTAKTTLPGRPVTKLGCL